MSDNQFTPNILDMTGEQISKFYFELSQQLYNQYHDRRNLEWRIHISLWTLLALTAYLFVTNSRQIGNCAYGIFLVVPLHFIWMIKIHRGEIREQNLSIYYRNAAEKVIKHSLSLLKFDLSDVSENDERSKMQVWIDKGFKSYYWWLGVELFTTLLLCIGVWFLIK